MDRNQIYRAIAAYFFAALILQVFVFQGISHLFGHHDHGDPCSTNSVHVHDIDNGHLTCDICLFQFAPAELLDSALSITIPDIAQHLVQSNPQHEHISQALLQTCLRGPPSTCWS